MHSALNCTYSNWGTALGESESIAGGRVRGARSRLDRQALRQAFPEALGREQHDELRGERRHGGEVEGQLRHADLAAVGRE